MSAMCNNNFPCIITDAERKQVHRLKYCSYRDNSERDIKHTSRIETSIFHHTSFIINLNTEFLPGEKAKSWILSKCNSVRRNSQSKSWHHFSLLQGMFSIPGAGPFLFLASGHVATSLKCKRSLAPHVYLEFTKRFTSKLNQLLINAAAIEREHNPNTTRCSQQKGRSKEMSPSPCSAAGIKS